MGYFTESLAQLFGREPKRPAIEEISVKVQEIHREKKANKITLEELDAKRRANRSKGEATKWLKRR